MDKTSIAAQDLEVCRLALLALHASAGVRYPASYRIRGDPRRLSEVDVLRLLASVQKPVRCLVRLSEGCLELELSAYEDEFQVLVKKEGARRSREIWSRGLQELGQGELQSAGVIIVAACGVELRTT